MPAVSESRVSLRVGGEELEPEEISGLLGCAASRSHKKGDLMRNGKNFWLRGLWALAAKDQSPENLDSQFREILGKLTDDISVWKELNSRFKIDLFCGLFLTETNEGAGIAPEIMFEIGRRGIEIDFEIYYRPETNPSE